MFLLRGIVDRIVLVAAVLAAGCVPSFVAQYRQRLGGRLDQVLQDLSLFQEIANRYHGGDLKKLIAHHLKSSDPTFRDEGIAIQKMIDTASSLRESLAALDTDLWHQVTFLGTRGDPELARATWDAFVPAFSLTGESVLFAFAAGVSIWLVFLVLWILIARVISAAMSTRPSSRAPKVARSSAGSKP